MPELAASVPEPTAAIAPRQQTARLGAARDGSGRGKSKHKAQQELGREAGGAEGVRGEEGGVAGTSAATLTGGSQAVRAPGTAGRYNGGCCSTISCTGCCTSSTAAVIFRDGMNSQPTDGMTSAPAEDDDDDDKIQDKGMTSQPTDGMTSPPTEEGMTSQPTDDAEGITTDRSRRGTCLVHRERICLVHSIPW